MINNNKYLLKDKDKGENTKMIKPKIIARVHTHTQVI